MIALVRTALLAAACVVTLPAAMVQVVQNGDFETGDLTGWDVTGNGASVQNDPNFGSFAAILDDNNSRGTIFISQFLTLPDDTVSVDISFDYLFNETLDLRLFSTDSFGSSFVFGINNFPFVNITNLVFQTSTTNPLVVSFNGSVAINNLLLTDPNALIEFRLTEVRGRTESFAGVDNVSIKAITPDDPNNPDIPEPGTWGLIALGCVALGMRRRKRS